MVKIKFEAIFQAFYDDMDRSIHIPLELVSPEKSEQLAQSLSHELDHYYLNNRPLNLAYDFIVDNAFKWWKVGAFLLLLGVMAYFQYFYLPNQAFQNCVSAYNQLVKRVYGFDPSKVLPFNFTGNLTK